MPSTNPIPVMVKFGELVNPTPLRRSWPPNLRSSIPWAIVSSARQKLTAPGNVISIWRLTIRSHIQKSWPPLETISGGRTLEDSGIVASGGQITARSLSSVGFNRFLTVISGVKALDRRSGELDCDLEHLSGLHVRVLQRRKLLLLRLQLMGAGGGHIPIGAGTNRLLVQEYIGRRRICGHLQPAEMWPASP